MVRGVGRGRADYNEWGEITYREALDITSSYRRIWPQSSYTGHDWDDVLGMYYAKARFYSAEDKRFVAMDPIKGNVTEPLSLVPYLYCVDNPLRWVDPLGLRLERQEVLGGAAPDAQALPWGTELVATKGNPKLYENYSPSSKALATIPNGGSVFSQNEAKENAKTTWYKVSYRGQIGWVDASYFKEKASNGTLTQNPAVQNKNQGRVPNTDPDPEPGPPKDAIPPYTKTTDFLFDNPYEYWDEASERAFSCASGCGWHTFAEHRAAGTPWAVWDRTLQENVASRLGQINNIYTDSALESGILYEQMIKTQQTGGQILDTAIENRRSELQTLPVEEVLQLLYLGLMYDEAQKMQDRLFPIYNGIGYAQGIVAPLYEQFPDYMDLAHVAQQGFSIGFHWGLKMSVLQAGAEAQYYQQLICGIRYGPANPGPLAPSKVETFRSSSYTMRVLTEDTVYYRVYDGLNHMVGSWMTSVPQNGMLQSQIDLALLPEWGNPPLNTARVVVPRGTIIYEGFAGEQFGKNHIYFSGGAPQVYIPEVNAEWFTPMDP